MQMCKLLPVYGNVEEKGTINLMIDQERAPRAHERYEIGI